jgi:hypothetical protein
MKSATLLLGLAIVLASIVTARAQFIFQCDVPDIPSKEIELIIEQVYVPTCPASTPSERCLSVKFVGYKITNAPIWGFDLRIKTKTPRRGVSTSGPEIVAVTLDGKRCRVAD